MEIIKRDNLIDTLEYMIKVAKEMPEEMYFYVNVEFSGIDENFQKIAHKMGVDREIKLQEEASKLEKREKN